MYETEKVLCEIHKVVIASAAYIDTLITVLNEKGIINQGEVTKRADDCLKTEGFYADRMREIDEALAEFAEIDKKCSLMKNLFSDALNKSDHEGEKAPTYLRNCRCGSCDKTDGMCYTSNPPKVKCTITGKYHLYDDTCDVLAGEG